MSREIDPVGITSSGARVSSPSRITEPLPNCFSMLASAASSALSRSPPAMCGAFSVVVWSRCAFDARDGHRQPVLTGRRAVENLGPASHLWTETSRTGVRSRCDRQRRRVAVRSGQPDQEAAARGGRRSRPATAPRCASTIPLHDRQPEPRAPDAGRLVGRSGVRAEPPRQATSKTRSMSASGMPPHWSLTLSSTPSGTARPRISTVPSAGVCRIAFMTRLVITRDSPTGSARHREPLLDAAAEPHRPRPGPSGRRRRSPR